MPDETTFKISFTDKSLEISGSEEFVKQQLDDFKSLINASISRLITDDSTYADEENDLITYDNNELGPALSGQFLNFAEDVIVIDDDEVNVIANVEGSTVAARMIDFVLLYMLGNRKIGNEEIDFNELREACENYGEFDGPNFSRHMNSKKNKPYFIIKGSGRKQSAKLTRPGIKKAEELIEQLSHD